MNSILFKCTPLSTTHCIRDISPWLLRLLKLLALTAPVFMPQYINIRLTHQLFLFPAALEVVEDAEDIVGTWS